MKFDNYYLDLEKVNSLQDKEEKEQIHRYYMDMMHFFSDNRNSMGMSLFNTLNQSGYLKELRSEKIEQILS
jgi:N-acetylneuraminic acid mutarotase